MADAALEKSMSIAAATRKEEEAAEESDDFSTDVSEHSQTSVDDCRDDSNDASIPGGDALAKDDKPTKVAMPGESRRRIIFVEFCTNPDSRIGFLAPPGVEVIRLTITDNLTAPAGLDKALKAINTPNAIIILFGALPCTGGSQWQRLPRRCQHEEEDP